MTSLERIAQLCIDALEEEQDVDQASLDACLAFFQDGHQDEYRPKITLTPEGRFRAHWLSLGTMREF